jgi:hypothetical protein
MAAQSHNRQGFYPVNPDAKISYLPVAATQTISRGDAVILSSGLVAIGLAGSAVLAGVIAEDSTLQTAGTLVACYIDPDEVFVGVADADSSSLVAGDEADLIGATSAMMIDADASTTDVFKLLRLHDPAEAAATARAQWQFKINKHAFAQID